MERLKTKNIVSIKKSIACILILCFTPLSAGVPTYAQVGQYSDEIANLVVTDALTRDWNIGRDDPDSVFRKMKYLIYLNGAVTLAKIERLLRDGKGNPVYKLRLNHSGERVRDDVGERFFYGIKTVDGQSPVQRNIWSKRNGEKKAMRINRLKTGEDMVRRISETEEGTYETESHISYGSKGRRLAESGETRSTTDGLAEWEITYDSTGNYPVSFRRMKTRPNPRIKDTEVTTVDFGSTGMARSKEIVRQRRGVFYSWTSAGTSEYRVDGKRLFMTNRNETDRKTYLGIDGEKLRTVLKKTDAEFGFKDGVYLQKSRDAMRLILKYSSWDGKVTRTRVYTPDGREVPELGGKGEVSADSVAQVYPVRDILKRHVASDASKRDWNIPGNGLLVAEPLRATAVKVEKMFHRGGNVFEVQTAMKVKEDDAAAFYTVRVRNKSDVSVLGYRFILENKINSCAEVKIGGQDFRTCRWESDDMIYGYKAVRSELELQGKILEKGRMRAQNQNGEIIRTEWKKFFDGSDGSLMTHYWNAGGDGTDAQVRVGYYPGGGVKSIRSFNTKTKKSRSYERYDEEQRPYYVVNYDEETGKPTDAVKLGNDDKRGQLLLLATYDRITGDLKEIRHFYLDGKLKGITTIDPKTRLRVLYKRFSRDGKLLWLYRYDNKRNAVVLYKRYDVYGNVVQQSFFNEETGDIFKVEYYDPDGKIKGRGFYDPDTRHRYLYEVLDRDGNVIRRYHYNPKTGYLKKVEYFECDGKKIREDQYSGKAKQNDIVKTELYYRDGLKRGTILYDSKTGRRTTYEGYDRDGDRTFLYRYDTKTGRVQTYERFDKKGNRVQLNTYNSLNGYLQQVEYFNASGKRTGKGYYDSVTRRRVIYEGYDAAGNVVTLYTYNRTTGAMEKAEYFYADGKKSGLGTYDSVTHKRTSYVRYDTNGNKTYQYTYNATTGVVMKYEAFDSAGNVTQLNQYNENGDIQWSESYYSDGSLKARSEYDSTTRKRVSYSYYDANGTRTRLYEYDATTGRYKSISYFTATGYCYSKYTYNGATGDIVQHESYDAAGNVRTRSTYDSVTRKRIIYQAFDAAGNRTHFYSYNKDTGDIVSAQYFRADGSISGRRSYDEKTRHCIKYEVFNGSEVNTGTYLYNAQNGKAMFYEGYTYQGDKKIRTYLNTYDPNTGRLQKSESFRTDGTISARTSYDGLTGKKIRYETFDAAGNIISTQNFDPNTAVPNKKPTEVRDSAGNLTRRDTYDQTTGDISQREYFHAGGGGLYVKYTYDSTTKRTVLYERFHANGTRYITYKYDKNTGSLLTMDYFTGTNQLYYKRTYNAVNGYALKLEYFHADGSVRVLYSYDETTGRTKTYEAFDTNGNRTQLNTYDPQTGRTQSAEYFRADGTLKYKHSYNTATERKVSYAAYDATGKNVIWQYDYDKDTGFLLTFKRYNSAGTMTQLNTYDAATGNTLSVQYFRGDGSLYAKYSYDKGTGRLSTYEYYDSAGNRTRLNTYDKNTGAILKSEYFYTDGKLSGRYTYNADTRTVTKYEGFDIDGNVRTRYSYRENGDLAKTQYFHPDGKLYSEGFYDKGTRHRVKYQGYDRDGNVRWQYSYDKFTGTLFKYEGFDINGNRTQLNTYNRQTGDIIRAEYFYADGKLSAKSTYSPVTRQRVLHEGYYRDGQRYYVYRYDQQTGVIQTYERFDIDGNRVQLNTYNSKTGRIEKAEYFHRDGKLSAHGLYDKETGRRTRYEGFDLDGNMTFAYSYDKETGVIQTYERFSATSIRLQLNTYNSSTGRIEKAEYFRSTDGTLYGRYDYDPETLRAVTYTGTDTLGRRTQLNTYNRLTGDLQQVEYFYADTQTRKGLRLYDADTRRCVSYEWFDQNGNRDWVYHYDKQTGLTMSFERFDDAGNRTQHTIYDMETGNTVKTEYFRADGTMYAKYAYNSKTGHLATYQSFDAAGTKQTRLDTYNTATGAIQKREYFRADGTVYRKYSWDAETRKMVMYEVIRTDGSRSGVYKYDRINGKVYQYEGLSATGKRTQLNTYNRDTGRLQTVEYYRSDGSAYARYSYDERTGKKTRYETLDTKGVVTGVTNYDPDAGVENKEPYEVLESAYNRTRKDTYDSETGDLIKREYTSSTDGKLMYRYSYDRETRRNVLYENFHANGNTYKYHYDKDNGTFYYYEVINSAGEKISQNFYNRENGNIERSESLRADGSVSYVTYYDSTKNRAVKSERFDAAGNRTELRAYDSATGQLQRIDYFTSEEKLRGRGTYDKKTRKRIQYEYIDTATGKVTAHYRYDAETGKAVLYEKFDSQGRLTQQNIYNKRTGDTMSVETYYPDGKLRTRSLYDPDTRRRVSYEYYDTVQQYTSEYVYNSQSGAQIGYMISYWSEDKTLLTKSGYVTVPGGRLTISCKVEDGKVVETTVTGPNGSKLDWLSGGGDIDPSSIAQAYAMRDEIKADLNDFVGVDALQRDWNLEHMTGVNSLQNPQYVNEFLSDVTPVGITLNEDGSYNVRVKMTYDSQKGYRSGDVEAVYQVRLSSTGEMQLVSATYNPGAADQRTITFNDDGSETVEYSGTVIDGNNETRRVTESVKVSYNDNGKRTQETGVRRTEPGTVTEWTMQYGADGINPVSFHSDSVFENDGASYNKREQTVDITFGENGVANTVTETTSDTFDGYSTTQVSVKGYEMQNGSVVNTSKSVENRKITTNAAGSTIKDETFTENRTFAYQNSELSVTSDSMNHSTLMYSYDADSGELIQTVEVKEGFDGGALKEKSAEVKHSGFEIKVQYTVEDGKVTETSTFDANGKKVDSLSGDGEIEVNEILGRVIDDSGEVRDNIFTNAAAQKDDAEKTQDKKDLEISNNESNQDKTSTSQMVEQGVQNAK